MSTDSGFLTLLFVFLDYCEPFFCFSIRLNCESFVVGSFNVDADERETYPLYSKPEGGLVFPDTVCFLLWSLDCR